MPHPGVQLYTVREQLAQEPEPCFTALAEMGYRHVEWFEVASLARLGPMAQDKGLSIDSCHVLSPIVTGSPSGLAALGADAAQFADPDRLLDLLAQFGVRHLVVGFLFPQERETLDHYRALAQAMNRLGELSRQRGIQLAYHNHDFELRTLGAEIPLELLAREFEPSLAGFELDIFWAQFAGMDPVQLIHRLGGRCTLLHLKDLRLPLSGHIPAQASPGMFAELGRGIIDLPGVMQAAQMVGVQDYYIEQDWTEGDPLQSLRISLEYFGTIQQ